MKTERHLITEKFTPLIQANSIEELSAEEIIKLFQDESALNTFKPSGNSQIDPRNGERILFNTVRSNRPHDYHLHEDNSEEAKICPICEGNTTGVLDWAKLSQGFTFINKNLYPILTLKKEGGGNGVDNFSEENWLNPKGFTASGLHFLQWTSSYHDRDWHNMPIRDCEIVMNRLAALEKRLLKLSSEINPETTKQKGENFRTGIVSIVKNHGSAVGGSLVHGHQQIVLSDILPRRAYENWSFKQKYGISFAEYLLSVNPKEYLVRDYGAASLMVPYYMRRPFDMVLVLRDTQKAYLHELNTEEIKAVALSWKEAINIFLQIMPALGKAVNYSIITNNGPGAGLYFEFLPYTQPNGGFEHLGLSVSQGEPGDVAEQIRELLKNQ